jgi:hypothetical protein
MFLGVTDHNYILYTTETAGSVSLPGWDRLTLLLVFCFQIKELCDPVC